jgi:hypothetical protein
MLVAGEPYGHVRDLLLLLDDERPEILDCPPCVLGRDPGAAAVVAARASATRFEGSQNRYGACELGARW